MLPGVTACPDAPRLRGDRPRHRRRRQLLLEQGLVVPAAVEDSMDRDGRLWLRSRPGVSLAPPPFCVREGRYPLGEPPERISPHTPWGNCRRHMRSGSRTWSRACARSSSGLRAERTPRRCGSTGPSARTSPAARELRAGRHGPRAPGSRPPARVRQIAVKAVRTRSGAAADVVCGWTPRSADGYLAVRLFRWE